jgi:hypothetical protein
VESIEDHTYGWEGELLEQIARNLVFKPDELRVEVLRISNGPVMMRVYCPESDIGKVIGKDGRTIDAIRSLFGAMAKGSHVRYLIDVYEPRRHKNKFL